ncbi:MAG: SCO family protein [Gammaproteobacteria bacterium]|nr:SCO family protein [Gammaproteobacteria bacterium]
MPTDHKENNNLQKFIIGTFAVIALLAGIYFSPISHQPATPPILDNSTLLMPPKLIQPAGLIDHNSKPFGLPQMQGYWSFVFFGYTNCPDVCPATLFQFKTIAKMLDKYPEIKAKTRFILVSIDPERDNPEHLKEYVQYYNPDFIGITGNNKDIYSFSRQMGIIFQRMAPGKPSEPDDYLVDHSSAILMLNPKGQLQAVFSAPHEANKILKDYLLIYNYLSGLNP